MVQGGIVLIAHEGQTVRMCDAHIKEQSSTSTGRCLEAVYFHNSVQYYHYFVLGQQYICSCSNSAPTREKSPSICYFRIQ
jgi:hypothetical protein